MSRELTERCLAQINSPFGQQNREEFEWLLNHVKGACSVLEIGSSFGHSLRGFSEVIAPGAIVRSIDLGCDDGVPRSTKESLRKTIEELCFAGFDAEAMFANSHATETLQWAKQNSPYDFIFIDGDHSYDGAKADWLDYGPLGRIVAFHDIEVMVGVKRLWREIETSGVATAKCVRPDPPWHRQLGTGVVFNAKR